MAERKGVSGKLREELGFSLTGLARAAWKEAGFNPLYLAGEGAKAGATAAEGWATKRRAKRLGTELEER